jgi:tetratricopeptide (TPR) repeat protein
MHIIDNGRFFALWRAKRVLDSELAVGVYTGAKFVNIQDSALYSYMRALIYLLEGNDPAWAARLKTAQSAAGWSKDLEANTLYVHATLLIRHKWRLDVASRLLKRVIQLSDERDDEDDSTTRHARALTAWGQLHRSQKQYVEARVELDKAQDVWSSMQKPGYETRADQKRWMAETNWFLLKTLATLRADIEEIDHLASKAIWHDPNWLHKIVAARLRIGRRKASDA